MVMTEPAGRPHRQHELDWLRILIIFNVVAWHAVWLILLIPDFSSAPKQTLTTKILLDYFLFVLPWQMPVMFFVAGVASAVSLRYRSARDYWRERVKRLLIPLVFGMVVWFPLMAYFWPGMAEQRGFYDYLFRFWPECLESIHNIQVAGRPARPGWGHLWFIAYLLIISVLIRPLVDQITGMISSRLKNTLARTLQGPWSLQYLALPIIAVIAVLSPIWPLYQNSLLGDWAWFTINTCAFVYGYLLYSQKSFWQTVDTYRIPITISAVLSGSIVVWFGVAPVIKPSYTLSYLLYSIIVGMNIWFAITALLGLSRRYLARQSQILNYLAPASYVLYFLHLFLMVISGSWLTEWGYGAGLEFLILTTLTLGSSLLLYELVIRRFSAVRFLFGLK
jgi:peptidoglycan/LPS O-acetylase OafA/YrhL